MAKQPKHIKPRRTRRTGIFVSYGRTVEVGRFGRGESGKVWFGWDYELQPGESYEEGMAKLRARADAQELIERDSFELRRRY